MRKNETKAKLRNGQTVVGCFVKIAGASLAEQIALQGFDFVILDAEHGPLSPGDCEHMARACELHGVTPLVRVTDLQSSTILRYLDAGAQGIHAPWVQTADQAREVVQAVKYHPQGNRGLGGVRAGRFMFDQSFGEYCRTANEETLIVAQIETASAVEQLPAIASVEGIDALFIGPTDLSHSFGYPGQPERPEVQAAIDRIVEVCHEKGKLLATIVGNEDAAIRWHDRGARYVVITFEAVLKRGAREFLDGVADVRKQA